LESVKNDAYSKGVAGRMARCMNLYVDKNHDYGDSWRKTGALLTVLFPKGVEIRTEFQHSAYGLLIRILDKVCRLSNLLLTGKEPKISEKVTETAEDLGVYGFMLAEQVEVGKGFDENS